MIELTALLLTMTTPTLKSRPISFVPPAYVLALVNAKDLWQAPDGYHSRDACISAGIEYMLTDETLLGFACERREPI